MHWGKSLLLVVLSVIAFSCAQLGSPDGGPRDTTIPKVLSATPDTFATNVPTSLKELRINFDKYVTLKDPSRQLIISPPIKKIKRIIPANIANKYILIQWEDTLKANTTYNFNFGNSIAGNNEGNILAYYNFVFSTGKKLDSLFISGNVDDVLQPQIGSEDKALALTSDQAKPVVVGLYKADSTANFQQKPYYLTSVDKDGYFELNYLAPGKYDMLAFQDDNQNSVYDPGKEKIAFLSKPLNLKKDTTKMRLLLSPPKRNFKFTGLSAIPGGLLGLYEGRPLTDSLDFKQVGDALKSFKIIKKEKSDSVYVWIDPKNNDFTETSKQIRFSYFNPLKKKVDSTSVYYKPVAKEALAVNMNVQDKLPPGAPLILTANMALKDLNIKNWKLTIDSTTVVPFKAEISPFNDFEATIAANFPENKRFQLLIPKETIQSYFYSNEKALLFEFATGKAQDYGTLVVHLEHAPSAPYWMQILDQSFKVVTQKRVKGVSKVTFENLKPDTYLVRVLVDENDNGEWDGADFAARTQPEPAYLWGKKLIVRPSWRIEETWDLTDTTPYKPSENDESLIPTGTEIKKIDLNPQKSQKNQQQNQQKSNPLQNQFPNQTPITGQPLRSAGQ